MLQHRNLLSFCSASAHPLPLCAPLDYCPTSAQPWIKDSPQFFCPKVHPTSAPKLPTFTEKVTF
ncbi:Protein CBG00569 [Caenorhabditis briggsae]|uniref:Protein CBG00569 n=1 Tax=Caenorhabditis briggsae TaxID=6238 RepID=A8WNK3_CAEBR|nr:Protein CBG00569 [Caenorhabditis briggsae]CAP22058.1 Protein CBG00569 [Caenorhabditis briggsae]